MLRNKKAQWLSEGVKGFAAAVAVPGLLLLVWTVMGICTVVTCSNLMGTVKVHDKLPINLWELNLNYHNLVFAKV